LPFDEPDVFTAADLIEAPSNQAARAALAKPTTWVNGRLVLWGEAGCGKSHLATLWSASHTATLISASRLRGPLSPDNPAVVIEDIDTMAAPIALFALLERATADGLPVLMTSRTPPARLTIDLADLASRLRASLTIQIEPAEPALLDALLVRLAAARQMTLTPSVHQFLLNRLPRRASVLREAIARLDRYALALGSAPSRRMAERLLAKLADPPEDEQFSKQPARHVEIHETDTPSLL
jgi:chromosomal replication initiation ATPase DnaA